MSITDLFLLTLVVKKVIRKNMNQQQICEDNDLCDSLIEDTDNRKLLRNSWNNFTEQLSLSVKRLSGVNDDSNHDNSENTMTTLFDDYSGKVIIRDFAYPMTSPLFHGQEEEKRPVSIVSLSSSEFHGKSAHALYDFIPEADHELGMKAGDIVWVQYRQSPGWLVADVKDETGLIPESYVEFIH